MPDSTPAELPTDAQILRGADQRPADVVVVRAGQLSAEFAGGGLRYVRLGDIEVVRRVGVAVRDQGWDTVSPVLSDVRIRQGAGKFRLTFAARHEAGELCFGWQGLIRGSADGSCSVSMDGTALTSFPYRRIGICVLHPPAEFAGRGYRASAGGESFAGVLPDLVAPPGPSAGVDEPLVPAFARLALAGRHVTAEFSCSGDHFEMEDQRNWTDASFKSYSRLPVAGGPAEQLAAGTRLRQTVTVTVTAAGSTPAAGAGAGPGSETVPGRARRSRRRTLRLVVGGEIAPRLPEVGLAHADQSPAAARAAAGLLTEMALAHLRVDLPLHRPGWAGRLDRAARQAQVLGCPLEVAVFLQAGAPAELERLAAALSPILVRRMLVYRVGAESTPAADVGAVRAALTALPAGTSIGGGTDLHFAELNRSRPDPAAMDCIAFPITPQVHAADEDSMTETPDGVRAVVATARSFAAGRPLVVSPITLRPRFSPDAPADLAADAAVAAAADADADADADAASIDPRQMSLFGACWTLATLKALATGRVSSTTWFETVGPRGVIENDAGPGFSGLLPSRPGMVFPVYHVLRDASQLGAAVLLDCACDDPLAVAGIAVRQPGSIIVLVANQRPKPSTIEIALPRQVLFGNVTIRRLNTVTAAAAMRTARSLQDGAQGHPVHRNTLHLDLLPYEYCRLDFASSGEKDG